MKINRYVDISTIDREAKKDYIDRHSPFVHCDATAKKDDLNWYTKTIKTEIEFVEKVMNWQLFNPLGLTFRFR